ncbi:MAG: hypothetical protein FJ108_14770 [Deltaproteobacteria bacterium]|nr:hypothetical protein [Deltaproteobacteria bacterium]
MDPRIVEVARAVAAAGGRALLVGGYVRDRVRGIESGEVDMEIYGLELGPLERLLARFGEVIAIGRAFGVLQVKGLGVDFALPRLDSKTGAGHKGFEVRCDPGLDFATAARRRDLTINSMGLDPLTGELLDPHGGVRDPRPTPRTFRTTRFAGFAWRSSPRASRCAPTLICFGSAPRSTSPSSRASGCSGSGASCS